MFLWNDNVCIYFYFFILILLKMTKEFIKGGYQVLVLIIFYFADWHLKLFQLDQVACHASWWWDSLHMLNHLKYGWTRKSWKVFIPIWTRMELESFGLLGTCKFKLGVQCCLVLPLFCKKVLSFEFPVW